MNMKRVGWWTLGLSLFALGFMALLNGSGVTDQPVLWYHFALAPVMAVAILFLATVGYSDPLSLVRRNQQ